MKFTVLLLKFGKKSNKIYCFKMMKLTVLILVVKLEKKNYGIDRFTA